MRKLVSVVTGLFLIIMLAACNQTAEPVAKKDNNTKDQKQTEEKSEKISELTLAEVFEKATAASEELKSFGLRMDLEQEITGPETVNVKSTVDAKATQNPMALHQKMKMTVPDTAEQMETEMYLTPEGIYMFAPTGEGWMKFPTEMAEELMQSTPQQSNPIGELKKLEKYVDDFKFEQDDNSYILTLKASGDKFNELINESIEQALQEMSQEVMASQDLNIKSIEYEIYIDKETFYPSKLNMKMDMDITAEGETISLKQIISGEYMDYNQIGEITIPQEIVDTAIEMEM